jgi:GNAT superfamily N-acetyltransferase
MTSSTTSVREANVGELAQVSATLADAFATEPLTQWLIPGQRRRNARLRRLFASELAHYGFTAGRVLTTDDFRGVSLELPSGAYATTALPLSALIDLVRVFGARLPRASRTQRLLEHHHPQESHYYLRYVGVASRFQGQGVATALLRPTLERCDQEGRPAYIEASSERSAALYQRLGFAHCGELRIPDGPRIWPMRRPPATA